MTALGTAALARFEAQGSSICGAATHGERCPAVCRLAALHGPNLAPPWGADAAALAAQVRQLRHRIGSVHPGGGPEVLVLGAQKSGTNALFAELTAGGVHYPHKGELAAAAAAADSVPDFVPPDASEKEPHFFDFCLGINGAHSVNARRLARGNMHASWWRVAAATPPCLWVADRAAATRGSTTDCGTAGPTQRGRRLPRGCCCRGRLPQPRSWLHPASGWSSCFAGPAAAHSQRTTRTCATLWTVTVGSSRGARPCSPSSRFCALPARPTPSRRALRRAPGSGALQQSRRYAIAGLRASGRPLCSRL